MRAGWNDTSRNAPQLARMVQDAGAAAVTIHGRTAAQSYSGFADWELVARVAEQLTIPVLGSGDCIEPEHIIERMNTVSGVLVGRGVLRNPWILAQAADIAAGKPPREVTLRDRGRFLVDYVTLLIHERVDEAAGFRHVVPSSVPAAAAAIPADDFQRTARGRERWVINKVRALMSWYSKGLDGGAELRSRINTTDNLAALMTLIDEFFFAAPLAPADEAALSSSLP
jgi:tRNA-dihydrouridine synthase B